MKTKSRQCYKRHRKNPALDLFGEVPVTWDEVYLWCEMVAGIPRDSWRLPVYVKGWDVPNKIRAAKLAGTYEATITPSRQYGSSRLLGILA